MVLCASGVVGGAAASGASPHPVCGPAGAQTLAADNVARVYATGQQVYGCAAGAKHAHHLGTQSFCEGAARVGPVVVAGRLAAYGLERCGIDTGSTEVVVRRLSDGKRLRSAPATGPDGVEAYNHVDSLVLKSDGAVAWIGAGGSIVGHTPGVIEVYKADASGVVVRLDSGAAVAGHSLRLHGSLLSWRNGEAVRHANLQ